MNDIIILSSADSDFFKESVDNVILDLLTRYDYSMKSYTDIKGKIKLDCVAVSNNCYYSYLSDIAELLKELFISKRLISICYNVNKKTIHMELFFINKA